MKTLEGIPFEHYDDAEYCHNYLNSNKTIGSEDTSYNGLFHVHWMGPLDNDKIILQIKSILATQKVKKIYFWIANNLTTLTSPEYVKLNQFHKYVEVKEFNKEVFDQASGDKNHREKIWIIYNTPFGDRRIKTDLFRHVILNIYGGVYTDVDTFLLRDLRDIKLKNWSSKWGRDLLAEFCILKLEKGSDVYEQMYLNNPNTMCYWVGDIYNNSPFSYEHNNINLTSLPTAFFDIVWPNQDMNLSCLTFNHFKYFFKETNKDVNLDNFFKGCFAYHWHNNWNAPELKNSFAGKLNADLDKIIEKKYNIKPIKIFQNG